ncbi:hypothetical protein [Marinivivus vitaminiproducens]|uniref:hypothetical protein n=1 Tax=Marinivivus vitaminiproducens TaxID=3035935 RepID=UPI0027A4C8C4|nr:hypothetical protein P4R82_14230 [Geminicoccaceae bacterium SCSIO 64248]
MTAARREADGSPGTPGQKEPGHKDEASARLPKPPRWTPLIEDDGRIRFRRPPHRSGEEADARAVADREGRPAKAEALTPPESTHSRTDAPPSVAPTRRLGPIAAPPIPTPRPRRRMAGRRLLGAGVALAALAVAVVTVMTFRHADIASPAWTTIDRLLPLPGEDGQAPSPRLAAFDADPQPPAPFLRRRAAEEAEAAALAERVQALRSEIAGLEAERRAAEIRRQRAEGEGADRIAGLHADATALERYLSEGRADSSRLKEETARASNELDRLRAEHARERDAQAEAIAALDRQRQALQAEVAARSRSVSADLEARGVRADQLEAEVAELERQRREITAANASLREAQATATVARDRLVAQADQASDDLSVLARQRETAMAELEAAGRALSRAQSATHELTQRQDRLEAELAVLDARAATPTIRPVALSAPAEPPGPPAPRPAERRVFIHFSAGQPDAERRAEQLARALGQEGVLVADLRPVGFAIGRDSVRYFFEGDATPASGLQALVGQATGRDDFALQDFTHYNPPPREGTIEVWLSNGAAS